MSLSRRHFLKASGTGLALPWLDSLGGFAHAADAAGPQRLLMIALPLGIYRDGIVPSQSGANYELPEYLKAIGGFRDRFTVISGLDHPGVNG
ncbi:MAG: hypothetical protein H7A52_09080, partial [Akkermansiaceae bacterium]|nr:hypothetical protein [Akkermansiaceae bacterium]